MQTSSATRQNRIQAFIDWSRQQAIGWITVQNADAEAAARGQSLAALTLVLMFVLALVFFVAILSKAPVWTLFIVNLLFLVVVLPTYLLARRGYIQTAARYFIACYTAALALTIVVNTDPNLGRSVLLDSMFGLNLTPLLAALLIRPRMALVTTLGNNAMQIGMVLIWQSVRPLDDHTYDMLTYLIAPIGDQFILGMACFLLASWLEAAGRQRKQRLAWLDSMLAALPVAVAVYDAEKRAFAFRNNQFEILTGVTCPGQRPSAARRSYELQTQGNAPPVPDSEWPWETAVRVARFGEFYAEIHLNDHSPINVQENVTSIPDMSSNRPTQIVYTAVDVTRQRQLQQHIEKLLGQLYEAHDRANQQVERLQELEHLKTGLLSNVGHELRTPLNSIMSRADLILNGSSGSISDLTAQDVRIIFESSGYLRTVVNEILDVAKLNSRSLTLDMQPLDLCSPIRAALATIGVLAEQKHLTLLEALPSSPVVVVGDATRLQQIVLNLLSNAVKFTTTEGVSLRLEVIGGQARVTVEDTGCGIPDNDREVIFEQFIQLRPDLGKKPEGTGLGLSIARALANLHKGALWLEESEVGRGSTFVFVLPLIQQTPGEALAADAIMNSNRTLS